VILDCHTREALATCARTNFRAYQVTEELDRLAALRGKPASIRVDNGPEFEGRMLDQWAYLNEVELDFSRPGKPMGNAFIEAFEARLRSECLNAAWFLSMTDARSRIDAWREDYNYHRPHTSLGNSTPCDDAEAGSPDESQDADRCCDEQGAPALAEVRSLVDRFQSVVRRKTEADLDPWCRDAGSSLIASFARGIALDLAAVRGAMTKPWSN